MDFLKEGYQAYSEFSQTGGSQYNAPHQQQGGGTAPQLNHQHIVQQAQEQAQGGDSSLFSSALGFIHQNHPQHKQPIDEAALQDAHQAAYHGGSAGSLDASGMGGAAAMQALKMFTQSGGGSDPNKLVSMAMSEASNLFDQSGGASSGNKQDAVNGAAMTVMKMMVQSQFSSMIGGGNSGGIGGVMGLAKKFF